MSEVFVQTDVVFILSLVPLYDVWEVIVHTQDFQVQFFLVAHIFRRLYI